MADDPALLSVETPSDGSNGIVIAAEQASTPQRATLNSDKLTIINQALINTSNTPVAVADDASDEWAVASSAYEEAVPLMLYMHDWKFATKFQALTRVGDSPYPGFADVFEKPGDALYIQNVYRTDLAALVIPSLGFGMPEEDTRPPDLEYRIVQDQVHCVGPEGVTAIYTPFPVGAQPWSIGFVASLRLYIETSVLRGLNEDMDEAAKREAKAEKMFAFAKSRIDAEEPRHVLFRSSVLERRRRRSSGYWP